MIIRNETTERLFLGWASKNGRYLDLPPETLELDDRLTQNEFFKELYNSGQISILSFENADLDYVVQAEIGGGGGGIDVHSATVVVGNSAEGDTLNDVDFLDDIQSAINSISSGKVYIRRGVYPVGIKIACKNNITLEGEGSGTILERAPGIDSIFDVSGLTEILIRKMKFRNAGIVPTAGNTYITLDGLDVQISDCFFEYTGVGAGTLTSLLNITASGNQVYRNKFNPDNVFSPAINITSNDNDIKDNKFINVLTAITNVGAGNHIVHNRGV